MTTGQAPAAGFAAVWTALPGIGVGVALPTP